MREALRMDRITSPALRLLFSAKLHWKRGICTGPPTGSLRVDQFARVCSGTRETDGIHLVERIAAAHQHVEQHPGGVVGKALAKIHSPKHRTAQLQALHQHLNRRERWCHR